MSNESAEDNQSAIESEQLHPENVQRIAAYADFLFLKELGLRENPGRDKAVSKISCYYFLFRNMLIDIISKF